MVLYLNLRYHEPLNNEISTGGVEMLLKWNDEDPVSDFERQRNNVIEKAQGNRNPFIDFPHWCVQHTKVISSSIYGE